MAKNGLAKVKRLTPKDIELIKRTVAKGVSDDEFALFLWVCKKHKLDPMTRQLHCVRRYLAKHHQDEKGIWVAGYQMTIQIGIDGYRALAGRDHPDYGGCDEPTFEFDEKDKRVPTVARIKLWKKGLEHPIVGVAYWDEYAPRDLNDSQAFMWKKMPKHMLAKCAEALALRKGYPELADIYTNEEMAQAADGHTPEGRQIVDHSAEEAQQEVVNRNMAMHRGAKVIDQKPSEPVEQEQSSEWIMAVPWKEGRLSLTGNGLPILKSELSPELLAELGIILNVAEKVLHMPEGNWFKLEDRATKYGIKTKLLEPAAQ